ncbi:MAG: MFS transporter [Chloroflexi bacterium]|nr:MFS transporter [Chloroflexota bacterium]
MGIFSNGGRKSAVLNGNGSDIEGVASHTGAQPGLKAGRVFDSFAVPEYRLFWAGSMGQMGAEHVQMVARSWLVYELTNSYSMLGLIMLAGSVPMLLLSLYGGVLADRLQKKRILQVGYAASAVAGFGIAIAIVLDAISLERHDGVGLLLWASLAQGVISGLMMPARSAIVPELVGQGRLMNAIALNQMGMNINRLLAPALAGLLIALVGIQTVYVTMTALYVIALVLATRLSPTAPMARSRRGPLGDMVEGLRYLRGKPILINLLLLTLISVALSMPYMALLPALAKDIQIVEPEQVAWITRIPLVGGLMSGIPDLLGKSSFRLGLLMSVSGIGALVSALLIAAMSNSNRGRIFLWSVFALGGFLALYAFSSSFLLALLFIAGVGLTQSARMALSSTLVQDYVDNEHRGRVMSVYMMEFGLASFSVYAVSLLADVVGVQWAIGGTALLLIPITLSYLAFVPSLRRLQ